MWAVLAVISAVGAAILGTREYVQSKDKGKKHKKGKVVFHDVQANHTIHVVAQRNKPH